MSQKFKVDISKFIYNDEFIENDCQILELVSEPLSKTIKLIQTDDELNLTFENTNFINEQPEVLNSQ